MASLRATLAGAVSLLAAAASLVVGCGDDRGGLDAGTPVDAGRDAAEPPRDAGGDAGDPRDAGDAGDVRDAGDPPDDADAPADAGDAGGDAGMPGGRYGPDRVELEPGLTVGEVALRFAPVWYHDTATGGPDMVGARADWPTNVDYDGDRRHDDNWNQLPAVVPSSFIYYALVATPTHLFLTYSHYHPRDWEETCSGLFTECHEGDMESIRLVVRRTAEGGEVIAVQTGAHGRSYTWSSSAGGVTDGAVSLEGLVDFETDAGEVSSDPTAEHTHLRMYAQEMGHGPIPCRARDTEPTFGYFGFGVNGVRCTGPGEPGFAGGDGVVLAPDDREVAYDVSLTDGDRVGYGLLNVEATLWQWRTEIGDGRLFRTDGAFTYAGARGTPEVMFTEEIGIRYDPDEFLVDLSSGSAPWNEEQPMSEQGDPFFDPALTWSRLLMFDHELDQTYTHNPYLYAAHATPP